MFLCCSTVFTQLMYVDLQLSCLSIFHVWGYCSVLYILVRLAYFYFLTNFLHSLMFLHMSVESSAVLAVIENHYDGFLACVFLFVAVDFLYNFLIFNSLSYCVIAFMFVLPVTIRSLCLRWALSFRRLFPLRFTQTCWSLHLDLAVYVMFKVTVSIGHLLSLTLWRACLNS